MPEQLPTLINGQLSLDSATDAGNVHDELLKVFRALHRLPVHESDKRAAMYRDKVLNNPHYHALKARMDLWCALWFWAWLRKSTRHRCRWTCAAQRLRRWPWPKTWPGMRRFFHWGAGVPRRVHGQPARLRRHAG